MTSDNQNAQIMQNKTNNRANSLRLLKLFEQLGLNF